MSSTSRYINDLFNPLEAYIDNMKTLLIEIEEQSTISESNNQILTNAKNMLNNIVSRLDINQKNVKSTLEHIDTIMASTTGGKKYKKHRKKTRKKRRN